jgi:hypothetical protein
MGNTTPNCIPMYVYELSACNILEFQQLFKRALEAHGCFSILCF